jgi:hypothetical protein
LSSEKEKVVVEEEEEEKDDGYYIAKARKLACYALRNQYWDLDRYCRGRSIYQRHGNAVGNGLVMVNGWQPPFLPPPLGSVDVETILFLFCSLSTRELYHLKTSGK